MGNRKRQERKAATRETFAQMKDDGTYENMLANFETARDAGLITVPRPRPAGFGNRKLRREAARKHARAVKAGAPRLSLVQPIEEQRDVSA